MESLGCEKGKKPENRDVPAEGNIALGGVYYILGIVL
jgi:hypothetical protein